ncbi:1,4-dihydroxy-2-naphthoate polyprenyltransferase [Actinomyces minihominis]|uniref:1,4-dihydroxy-2-naphthoate polyprenyltransferase n=1 Tax=Actinomyces minihominis TaxID=2002838 RepID=UPI000C08B486|nr:1,4-dihydroxy-2-naphthoate polyprenyltransferase [Actinomyces minihominis]
MATPKDWLEGARLRTLPAAAAPVLVGAGAAIHLGSFSAVRSLLALGVALALQIGVNLANDYSDGIRGTDEVRVGPTRLTASGLVSPRRVLAWALACFGLAALLGLILIVLSGHWWLLAVGAASVGAAWFYTGGRRPYGYAGVGLSELFVLVFFGLVATGGTVYVQTTNLPWWVWTGATGIGLISVALLMINNIRDIPTDIKVGKITAAVRMGDSVSRGVYVALAGAGVILGSITVLGAGSSLWWIATLLLLILAFPGVRAVMTGASGRELLGALRNTGLSALGYGVVVGTLLALTSALAA